MNETIVAISTPIAISALSIVRLSGSRALEIAKIITKSNNFEPRYAHLKYIYSHEGHIIDRCIVIYFRAPHSFNGEDIIEFQSHGGVSVPKNIIDECIRFGARIAKAGEFSKIAILNNKMDMATAENIAKLITTQGKQASKILARILNGELGKFVDDSRRDLINILAHIEVLIDYAEEDLPGDIEDLIHTKLDNLIKKLGEIYDHSLSLQHVIDGHRMVIIGKPNVGKSSLLNRLLLKDKAIISDIEGTTRDIVEDTITIDNQIIKIIDTAGIRESKDIIEKIGIQKSIECVREATIIVAVFDGSKEFNDNEILEILDNNKEKIIIAVVNKNDKKQYFDETKLKGYQVVKISTINNDAFKVRDAIKDRISSNNINNQEIILSSTRQIGCIRSCINELNQAVENIYNFEIFSFHINEAISALNLITRPFNNDELLDTMFSEFCLGK